MKINIDDFRRHFEILSDDALLATNRDDLVEGARQCFDQEVARRDLNLETEAGTEEQRALEPVNVGDDFVSIGTFVSGEEANLARGLLGDGGIPAILTNEHSGLGMFQLELKVPSGFVDQALEILSMEISEEELAAQAEAADESAVEEPE
jgi:hypothetical protein